MDINAKTQIESVTSGLQGIVNMLSSSQDIVKQQIESLLSARLAQIENSIAGLQGAIGACEVKKIGCATVAGKDGKSHYHCKMPAGIVGPLTVAVRQGGTVTEYSVARNSATNPAFATVSDTTLDMVFDKQPESVEIIDPVGSASLVDKLKTHWQTILQIGEKIKELYELVAKLAADQANTTAIVEQISGNQVKTSAALETQVQALVTANSVNSENIKKIKKCLLGIAETIGN